MYAVFHYINCFTYYMKTVCVGMGVGFAYETGILVAVAATIVAVWVAVDMGEDGEKAVRLMFDMAKQKGLVPDFELKISKPLWLSFFLKHWKSKKCSACCKNNNSYWEFNLQSLMNISFFRIQGCVYLWVHVLKILNLWIIKYRNEGSEN